MIINSVIKGTDNKGTIDLGTTMESTDFLLANGGNLTLSFTYTDSIYSEASVTYYMDDYMQDTVTPRRITTTPNNWNITSLIGPAVSGLHIFRIAATNYNNKIDYIDYRVLYDYPKLVNMTFELNGSGYTLINYINPSVSIEFLDHAYTSQNGIQPLTIIGPGALYDNDITTTIILPATITKIESTAFTGMDVLTSLTIRATVPPELEGNTFDGTQDHLFIYVPSASLSAYQTAWNDTGLTTATIIGI